MCGIFFSLALLSEKEIQMVIDLLQKLAELIPSDGSKSFPDGDGKKRKKEIKSDEGEEAINNCHKIVENEQNEINLTYNDIREAITRRGPDYFGGLKI
jgi:hypothetical protein